jgi:hypothetical protein
MTKKQIPENDLIIEPLKKPKKRDPERLAQILKQNLSRRKEQQNSISTENI